MTDTVEWFPTATLMPVPSATDTIAAALNDITNAIKQPTTDSPLSKFQDSEVEALRDITTIFQNHLPEHLQDTTPKTSSKKISWSPDIPENPPTFQPHTRAALHRKRAQKKHWESMLANNQYALLRVEDDEEEEDETTTNNKQVESQEEPITITRQDKTTTPEPEPPAEPLRVPVPVTPSPKKKTKKKQHRQHPMQTRSSPQRNLAFTAQELDEMDQLAITSKEIEEMNNDPNFYLKAYAAVQKDLQKIPDLTQFCYKAVNPDTGKLAEYRELRKCSQSKEWDAGMVKEIHRLVDKRTAMKFIPKQEVPHGKTVTYSRIVAAYRPQKADPYRVRLTVGGNLLETKGDVGTRTADLVTAKLFINSTLSTEGARFMCMDISDFYLNSKYESKEAYRYMRISLQDLPQTIIDEYKLEDIAVNGYAYIEISGGMYGLPEAGKMANRDLIKVLTAHDFKECEHTDGVFIHKTRPLSFCLIVDDFSVKYVGKEHAEWLSSIL